MATVRSSQSNNGGKQVKMQQAVSRSSVWTTPSRRRHSLRGPKWAIASQPASTSTWKVSQNVFKKEGFFWIFFLFLCTVRHLTLLHLPPLKFHCGAEDAGIEPRTVATKALAVGRSNHSARSHPHNATHYYLQCFGSVFIWYGSGSNILGWIPIRIQSRIRVLITKKSEKFTAKKIFFWGGGDQKLQFTYPLVSRKDV